ncbi:MAG: endonuclease/exonuclease/phosphatase family protein [Bacteroidales bacterium]|nr:endonuclease/exonuclease/phosphatase family protein [Bacteroidales bacterium]
MKSYERKKHHRLLGFLTICLFLMGIGGLLSGYISPFDTLFFHFLGIILPFTIALNLFFFIYWIFRINWFAILPFIAVLVNVGYISAMYQFPKKENIKEAKALNIVTYNVHKFMLGNSGNSLYNITMLFEKENVDIACMQEYSSGMQGGDSPILFENFPFSVEKGEHAILSKYPIIYSEFVPYVNSLFTLLFCDIDINGKTIRVISSHLETTGVNSVRSKYDKYGYFSVSNMISNYSRSTKIRLQQATVIKSIIDTTNIPVILCCDINDTPTSFTYRKIKVGLRDGFKDCGEGFGATYFGLKGFLRIDYIFYDKSITGVDYHAINVKYSDHKPIIFSFSPPA